MGHVNGIIDKFQPRYADIIEVGGIIPRDLRTVFKGGLGGIKLNIGTQ